MWQLLTSFEVIFTVVTGVVLVSQTKLISPSNSLRAEAEYASTPTSYWPEAPATIVPTIDTAPSPSAEPSPTSEPSATLTPTKKPTTKPPPTAVPENLAEAPVAKDTIQPTPPPTSAAPPSTTNSLLSAVNEYRKSSGKPEFSSRDDLCSFTNDRAQEIGSSFSHDGFQRRLSDGSFNQLNYSGIAENIFSGSDSVSTIVNGWKNSSGHNANMLGDYAWGCGKIEGDKAVFLFLK